MGRILQWPGILLGMGALFSALAAPEWYVPEPGNFKRAETVRRSEIVAPVGDGLLRPADTVRSRSLDGLWKFSGVTNSAKPFSAAEDIGPAAPDFDDRGWTEMPVPLDWFWKYPAARKTGEPYMKGWYRREFELDKAELNARRVILKFDTVGYDARVFLNGMEIGRHRGEFTAFELDATAAARPGRNLLAVHVRTGYGPAHGLKEKVDHTRGCQWGLSHIKGGIWQSVTLSLEPELRIPKLLVTPDVAKKSVRVDYTILNHTGKNMNCELTGVVTDAMKSAANRPAGGVSDSRVLKPGVNTGSFTVTLREPQLWSVDRPYLYWLNLFVRESGRVLSSASARFGMREFRAENGRFLLNGEPVYLFGESIASSLFPGRETVSHEKDERDITRYILSMRNAGYVILRTVHQPVMPLVLEVADECGMMIFNEWGWCFDPMIDEAEFEKNNIPYLRDFVEATYNHPAVVMWSLGNEVPSQSPEVSRQLDLQVRTVRGMDRQRRPVSTFSGAAGWRSYGTAKHDTDVLDLHHYVGIANPWTERDDEVDGTWQGLARIYGAEELRRKPLIAMETVGFSWGFMTPDNKNPNFRRNSPEEYRRYAESDTSWGSPRGIGFSGTLPLADAVDPEFGEAIPMMRYGKRILELYRLDSRFCGFAPWFGRPEFRSAALFTQPVLPMLHNDGNLPPRSLYGGESSEWILDISNVSNRNYANLTLVVTLKPEGRGELPVVEWPVPALPAWRNTARRVSLPLPEVPAGFHQLRLTLREGERVLARNYYDLYLAQPDIRTLPLEPVRKVYVYDTGAPKNVALLADRLKAFSVPYTLIGDFSTLRAPGVLIIPAEAAEKQVVDLREDAGVMRFVEAGGVLLLLEQRSPEMLAPGALLMSGCTAFCDPVVTTHPIFKGLTARNFDTWNNPDHGYVATMSYQPFTVNALAAKGAFLSRREVGMALVEAVHGKGRILMSQFEAFRSAPQDSSAMQYLRNLFAYAVCTEEFWSEARPFSAMEESGFRVVPGRLEPVDLKPYVNRSFTDEADGDRLGGWTDQGTNDMRMMPLGRVAGPGELFFDVIDPAENGGKSCIVLAGTERRYFPRAAEKIAVNRKFSRLFFLHTAAWGGQPEAGWYRIRYVDGKTVDIPLVGGKNIGDWWNPGRLPMAQVGVSCKNPAGYNVGAYIMEWENPRPETEIASFDFLSPLFREGTEINWRPDTTAVPILIAVTGERAHPKAWELTGAACLGFSGGKETGSPRAGRAETIREAGRNLFQAEFPASAPDEHPAAILRFKTDGIAENYDYLTLTIRSRDSGVVEAKMPREDWSSSHLCHLTLKGDGKPHTFRLRLSKEMKTNNRPFSAARLRGELWFFYRSPGVRDNRPPLRFAIERAVLE